MALCSDALHLKCQGHFLAFKSSLGLGVHFVPDKVVSIYYYLQNCCCAVAPSRAWLAPGPAVGLGARIAQPVRVDADTWMILIWLPCVDLFDASRQVFVQCLQPYFLTIWTLAFLTHDLFWEGQVKFTSCEAPNELAMRRGLLKREHLDTGPEDAVTTSMQQLPNFGHTESSGKRHLQLSMRLSTQQPLKNEGSWAASGFQTCTKKRRKTYMVNIKCIAKDCCSFMLTSTRVATQNPMVWSVFRNIFFWGSNGRWFETLAVWFWVERHPPPNAKVKFEKNRILASEMCFNSLISWQHYSYTIIILSILLIASLPVMPGLCWREPGFNAKPC